MMMQLLLFQVDHIEFANVFKNVAANHRAKDSVALENQPQVISGRFVFGLLDMVNLTGEIVDLYALLPVSDSHIDFIFQFNGKGQRKKAFCF